MNLTTCCDYSNSHPEDTFNKTYHDTQYVFPLKDDNLLLGTFWLVGSVSCSVTVPGSSRRDRLGWGN
jgi:hypothetical protein